MPGSIIVAAIFDVAVASFTFAQTAMAFAINMIASSIVSRVFSAESNQNSTNGFSGSSNPGNPTQIPPSGENKLPVVYGTAFVGGIITDLSISTNNQTLYYVLALSEVTNTNTGATPDTITFGAVYWGGKKVVFSDTVGETYKVTGLLDESNSTTDTTVAGKMEFYFYSNGSSSPTNSTTTAIALLQDSSLTYQWDSTKLMTNCAFVVLKLTYSNSANIHGIQSTRFQVTNSRYAPGNCFFDYLTSTRYGAAIAAANVDTASLTALNVYSAETMTYTPYGGGSASLTRFRFDGVLDTDKAIMNNLQLMATSCDCLIKYNEIMGKWGVIVQQPTAPVVMALTDSNLIGTISVTPIDIASSFNIAEVKFPDGSAQDSFNTATYDLAIINPSLLFPNEPVNKQSISLQFVNNNVRAQNLANRFLEACREDLNVLCVIDYTGLQLEAGDIVSLTNTNYSWEAKLFRITKVIENFGDDGSITASLTLAEYNPAVFDDANITQFTPSPNSGFGNPMAFGTLTVPSVASTNAFGSVPSFNVNVTVAPNGIVQYVELWYSAYASPTTEQRLFVGTSAIQSSGNPYAPGAGLSVTVSNIAAGNWYFFSRMVNSLGASNYSAASAIFQWRPTTFQYIDRYVVVVYGDSITGTGLSIMPTGKTYYGLRNLISPNVSDVASNYTWYLANTAFGTNNYLLYANRGNRKFSFNVGNASYANLGGAFVPTETSVYDASAWAGLNSRQDPPVAFSNVIDLDARTGQLIATGTTKTAVGSGELSVTNQTDGLMVVSLAKFLNFGAGVYLKNFSSISNLTIDIYGRVVGFTQQDSFYYTESVFSATAGQTSFAVTHIVGAVLVFQNGLLLDTSNYSETTTTVVLNSACVAGELVIVINMRAVSTDIFYEPLNIVIASSTTTTVTYSNLPYQIINAGDQLAFTNTGTPSLFTVSSIDTTTKVITFTTSISGATAGNTIYRYRAAASTYSPFSRFSVDLTSASTYTPTTYAINSGFEQLFVNGSGLNEIDYDIVGDTISGFPSNVTGKMELIMFSANNLGVPCSNITNTVAYSVNGAVTYAFASNPLAMEVYANGVLLAKSYDYTASATNYNLTTAFTNNSTLLNQQTFARIGAA